MVVEESIVDQLTGPDPRKRQMQHLHWCGGVALYEAVQGLILQQSVVTDSTEQVHLKNIQS